MLTLRALLLASASTAFLALAVAGPVRADHAADGGQVSTSGPTDVSGTNGTDGDPPQDGGDGGQAAVTTNSDIPGNLPIYANGGDGGKNTGTAGPGGAGGNGGQLAIEINNKVGGGITAYADGGDSGISGDGITYGVPGTGGQISIVVSSEVGTVAALGKSIVVSAKGGDAGPTDPDGTAGQISITLKPGAVLESPISADPSSTTSLTFELRVNSRSDFDAANSYLHDASHTASGSITVDGHTYAWTGIDQLNDLLQLHVGPIQARFGAGGSISASKYLHCIPGGVIAYHQGGTIVFNARQPDKRSFFHVGDVAGGVFASANPIGWTVAVKASHYRSTYTVLDAAQKVVAVCKG